MGQFIFLLLDYTRSCLYDKGRAAAQPFVLLPPLVNLSGSGSRETQQKKHCQAREAGSSLVQYFTLWEAVHHVEILSDAGGGLVVVFQHLFLVALVDGAAGLAGSGGSTTFLRGFLSESWQR